MKKWYSSFLRDVRGLGDKVFVVDPYNLLRDPNFFKEISDKYAVHKYNTDNDFFRFSSINSGKPLLVYSSSDIRRGFINSYKKTVLELSEVFDGLNNNILKEVDISFYQKIFNDYQSIKSEGRLVDRTEDFILKSVWGIDLGSIHSPTENLKIALAYIVDGRNIPDSMIAPVSRTLSKDIKALKNDSRLFSDWLKGILISYVDDRRKKVVPMFDLSDAALQFYLLKASMSYDLGLDLMVEEVIGKDIWLAYYKKNPDKGQIVKKVQSEVAIFKELLMDMVPREFDLNEVDDLLKISKLFCEILYTIQINDLKISEYIDLDSIYDQLDKLFRKLVNEQDNKYQALFHYPHKDRPYTADKIIDYICSNNKNRNVALIVFDGMSYDEWFILKEKLDYFEIEEKEIFAIVPTTTSFSRTSIFSGRTPKEFMTNGKKGDDSKEFNSALNNRGFDKKDILYGQINLKTNMLKTDNDNVDFNLLKDYKFLGMVCNLFDELSHEKVITVSHKTNLYKKITNEIESSNIVGFLKQLKNDGYIIFVTSDHGNIFCKGNGIKPNKNLEIDRRESSRCLIYDKESLAEELTNSNPYNTFRYRYDFIPEDFTLVLAKTNECFINVNDYLITHGGISPEELIIPFAVLK